MFDFAGPINGQAINTIVPIDGYGGNWGTFVPKGFTSSVFNDLVFRDGNEPTCHLESDDRCSVFISIKNTCPEGEPMLIGRELINLKQERIFQVDYNWLADAEEVLHVDAVVTPNDGIFSIDQMVIAFGGKSVQFMVKAGDGSNDGEEYSVRLITQTKNNIDETKNQRNDDCIRFLVSCGGCC